MIWSWVLCSYMYLGWTMECGCCLIFTLAPQVDRNPCQVLPGLIESGQFVNASIAPSTKRMYLTGQWRYLYPFVWKEGGFQPLPLQERRLLHVWQKKDCSICPQGVLVCIKTHADSGDPFTASWNTPSKASNVSRQGKRCHVLKRDYP